MTDWNFYMPIPFKEKGRDFSGCDCWGLGMLIMRRERGIILPGYEEFYERTTDKATLKAVIAEQRQERWTEVEKPQAFDFILLKIDSVPMHVGVVTKPGKMIHCAKGTNTVHESYLTMRWEKNIMGFFRYG